MNDRPIAHVAMGDGDAGADGAIPADHHVWPQHRMGAYRGAGADEHPLPDDDAGIDDDA